jgi:hypothetical protein
MLRMHLNDPAGMEELVEYYPAIKDDLFYADLMRNKQ